MLDLGLEGPGAQGQGKLAQQWPKMFDLGPGRTKPRNLLGFVAWDLEKHRFGCIFSTENAAKPWFWRPGGLKTMYFTRLSASVYFTVLSASPLYRTDYFASSETITKIILIVSQK